MKSLKLNKFATLSLTVIALAGTSQFANAHTGLQNPVIDENSASHGSNYNNLVISHGCLNSETNSKTRNTVGTVVVFPDGIDSIVMENGEISTKTTADFVPGWGSPVAKIQNKDVFDVEDEIKTPLGNVVGFWAYSSNGTGLQGGLTGVIPFRTSGVVIDAESCATSVKFLVAIADVCDLSKVEGFDDTNVQLWTPAVGSNFDGEGNDSPASLKVNRSLSTLPESCGDGVEVIIKPSAAQLNRDMPVSEGGVQIWPVP